ncbi:ureidoglycolate hydrolase [Xylogone sp. PMI_703]|nr:ureidoglycolate hydrolase [Xylogone sp. PMI_703]
MSIGKMVRTIHCEPLTEHEYAPYGGIISTDIINDRTVSVNNGTARRTPEVVPTQNLYDRAPSQIPARAVLNVSLAQPRDVEPWKGATEHMGHGTKRVLKVKTLERHRYSTQSFIPMGADIKYLVVVTDGGDTPNMDQLRGFIASAKQGICYGPGIWHAPMSVIDQPISFAVVQHINGVPEEDCQFFHLEEELEVIF